MSHVTDRQASEFLYAVYEGPFQLSEPASWRNAVRWLEEAYESATYDPSELEIKYWGEQTDLNEWVEG